jgi:hypothetical protein
LRRVGRLRSGRDHADELAATPESDDVDQVARLERREPDLDTAERARLERDHLGLASGPLVDDQLVARPLGDDAGHPADVGPDPVGNVPPERVQPDDRPVVVAQRGRL